jgi:hypothetical protein
MNSYEERQAARKARLEERAAKAQREGSAKLNQARGMASHIPFGQPILVGHHSEGRDRRYRQRIHDNFGKGFAHLEKAEALAARAESVGTGGISSDDPEAIAKLKAELEGLEANQERMKAANKVIRARAGDEEEQVNGLVALGWLTSEKARELVRPDFCGRIGFPAYSLSNNNANMARIRLRIKDLEKRREAAPVAAEGKGYTYKEDPEENRVMFMFDGKPDEAVRGILKSHAFKWSPSRGAWVRQLTGSGVYAGQCVRERLDKLHAEKNPE